MSRSFLLVLLLTTLLAAPARTPLAQEAADDFAPHFILVARRQELTALLVHCSVDVPDLKPQLEAAFADWSKQHTDELAKADANVAGLPAESRRVLDLLTAHARGQLIDQLEWARENGKIRPFCESALATFGRAQQSAYVDAGNYDDAVSIYATAIVSNEELASKCVAQFPSMRGEIAAAQAKDKSRDAGIRERADAEIASFRKANPELASERRDQVRQSVEKALATLNKVSADVAEGYCREHFSALASGAWRKRTPKVYEYLEAAGRQVRQP